MAAFQVSSNVKPKEKELLHIWLFKTSVFFVLLRCWLSICLCLHLYYFRNIIIMISFLSHTLCSHDYSFPIFQDWECKLSVCGSEKQICNGTCTWSLCQVFDVHLKPAVIRSPQCKIGGNYTILLPMSWLMTNSTPGIILWNWLCRTEYIEVFVLRINNILIFD